MPPRWLSDRVRGSRLAAANHWHTRYGPGLGPSAEVGVAAPGYVPTIAVDVARPRDHHDPGPQRGRGPLLFGPTSPRRWLP